MPIKPALTAVAVAFGLTGGFAAPALAQVAPEAEAEMGVYTEEQLASFVAAALEVSGIQQEAAVSLMEVETEAEQAAVLEEANQAVIGAIEATPDITVPEYVAIAEAAETDPALRAQLEEMMLAAQTQ